MHLEEDDANDLKDWVVVRLKDISDADSDVLADYVLALVRTDTPYPQLKLDVSESLEDFLKENTTDFVHEIFQALQSRSYKPGYVPSFPNQHVKFPTLSAPRPGSFGQSNQPHNESRKRSYNDAGLDGPETNSQHALRGDKQMRQMRGRGSRGGRGNGIDLRRGGLQQSNGYNRQPAEIANIFPVIPNLSDMPQFDPNDPMAAIMAMQAMGLPPLPGMEGLLPQQVGAQSPPGLKQNAGNGVCQDYVNKGYCTRGDACPYQHINPMVMPGHEDGETHLLSFARMAAQYQSAEYDPKDSLLTSGPFSPQSLANSNFHSKQTSVVGYPNESRGRGRGHDRGRGRGHGGNDRGSSHKPNRAEFSHAGPNHDRGITTIVVEQIPEEKFSEEAVREFFSDFGAIETITMQPYKRLAIVKFSEYSFARAAYDSPRVIFDNRFVKVYWYKPGSVPTPSPGMPTTNHNDSTIMREASPPIDMEAFATAATAAQAKLDAKKAALAATQSQREALEKQKADLAAKQAAEKEKLLSRLAAKGKTLDDPKNGTSTAPPLIPTKKEDNPTTPKAGDSAHTLMLRVKVAELEAEAKRLGLPDSALSSGNSVSASSFAPRGRGRGRGRGGRGSYRGWEAFDPSASYRGGHGGGNSGSPFVPARGGGSGKYNLDLRTKRVAITLPSSTNTEQERDGSEKWTAEKDEALRQHLLGVGEFEDIIPRPDKEAGGGEHQTDKAQVQGAETLVVIFKDRVTAEGFLYGVKGKEVPGLGKVAVSWFNGPDFSKAGRKGGENGGDTADADADVDVNMGNGLENGNEYHRDRGEDDGDGKDKDGLMNANGNGNGSGGAAAAAAMSGGGLGLAEGDYDVAEEDDDSWMT